MNKKIMAFMTALSLALGCCANVFAEPSETVESKPLGLDRVKYASDFSQATATVDNPVKSAAGAGSGGVANAAPADFLSDLTGTWKADQDGIITQFELDFYYDTDGVVVETPLNRFPMLSYYPNDELAEDFKEMKKIEVTVSSISNKPAAKAMFGHVNDKTYNCVNISKLGQTSVTSNGLWSDGGRWPKFATRQSAVDGTAWAGEKTITVEFIEHNKIKYTVGSYESPEITVNDNADKYTEGQPLVSVMLNIGDNAATAKIKSVKMWYTDNDGTKAEMSSDREAYYRLYDSVDAEIKTDTVLNIAKNTTMQLSGLIKGVTDDGTGFAWTSANDSVVTVSNGLITAVGLGETTVKATVDNVEMSVDVKVLGEFGNAIETNTLPDYFADKATAIARYNACVENNDEDDFYAMFNSTANNGLAYIGDLDITERHSELTEAEIKALGKRLFSYGQVNFTTKENAEAFFNNFNLEIRTGELCKITDTTDFETAIAGEDFGCNTDTDETSETYNSYYADNKEYVLGIMLAKDDYKNAADVKSVFDKYSVFGSIIENISYSSIGEIIAENKDILGYSTDITDSDALGEEVLKNIDTLDTPGKLVDYINDYEAPTPTATPKPTKRPNPPGGGGGGGSPLVIPEKTPEPVEDENGELVQPEPERVQIFPDVPTDHWAYEGTRYLSGMGAASGYDDGDFRPNGRVTRAEFLKMFLICQGIEVPELAEDAVGTFVDVDITEWYGKYIEAAYSNGLIEGDDDMNANPNEYISRQELAAIVMRAYDRVGKDFVQTAEYIDFTDKDSIAPWAVEAVSRLQLADVINGDENKCFNPLATATRAETAKILYKLIETEPYVAPVETTEAESEVENEN